MTQNLKKVDSQIYVETFFDSSFLEYCKFAGLEDSVKIKNIAVKSGEAINEFTLKKNGLVYFDINGLQARLKGSLEPYLNKLFFEQLQAFDLPKNENIFVDVSPVLLCEARNVVYIMVYVQQAQDIKSYPLVPLHNISIH